MSPLQPARWARHFAVLLLAATALFVVGIAAERSVAAESSGGAAAAESHAEGESPAEEAQDESEESDDGHDESVESETLFGVSVESTPLVAGAVLLGLALAAAAWWRPARWILLLGTAYCLGAAALDARELLHQVDESRTGIASLAAVVGLLHLAAGAVGLRAATVEAVPKGTAVE